MNGTGNGTVVEVVVPGNATNGTVKVVIGNVTYNGTVVNGTVVINLTNVTPGVHNATIIYIDGNNVTSELNTTIAVPKWSTGIDVDVREGLDGTRLLCEYD